MYSLTDLQKYQDLFAAYIELGAAKLSTWEFDVVMLYVCIAAMQPTLTPLLVGQAVSGAWDDGYSIGRSDAKSDMTLVLHTVAVTLSELQAVHDQIPPLTDGTQFGPFAVDVLRAAYRAGFKAGQGANESAHSQPAMSAIA